MTLDERTPRYHDAPRGSGERADPAAYARDRARIQADARARAEREARLNAVDATKIYWA